MRLVVIIIEVLEYTFDNKWKISCPPFLEEGRYPSSSNTKISALAIDSASFPILPVAFSPSNWFARSTRLKNLALYPFLIAFALKDNGQMRFIAAGTAD